jgi:hypothetical protein
MYTCFFFLYFIYAVSSISRNFNYNIQIRNTGLRMIIFKEKKLPKIVDKIKGFYELCYYKSIVSMSDGINDYYNLSPEDRNLIESIISLCY